MSHSREPGPRPPRRSAGHHARAPPGPAHGCRDLAGSSAPAGGAGRGGHLRGPRWLQAPGPLAPRGAHPRPRGRGRRRRRGRGQGQTARGQHAPTHREPDGRGARGPLPHRRRSSLAHSDRQAAWPRARLGGPALDARPSAHPRTRSPSRRGAALGHHREHAGQLPTWRADASGREHRAPRASRPRGRRVPRHLARRPGHRDARGAAARSPHGHARARRAVRLPPRPHGARDPGALCRDRTRAGRAHAPGPRRIPRPRPPGP